MATNMNLNVHRVTQERFTALKEAEPWNYHKVGPAPIVEWLELSFHGLTLTLFPEDDWQRRKRLASQQ